MLPVITLLVGAGLNQLQGERGTRRADRREARAVLSDWPKRVWADEAEQSPLDTQVWIQELEVALRNAGLSQEVCVRSNLAFLDARTSLLQRNEEDKIKNRPTQKLVYWSEWSDHLSGQLSEKITDRRSSKRKLRLKMDGKHVVN